MNCRHAAKLCAVASRSRLLAATNGPHSACAPLGHTTHESLRSHPRERIGYVVRNEQQTQTLGRKVRGYILPEAIHIRLSIRLKQCQKLVSRIPALRIGLALECVAQLIRRPRFRGVCRILQKLSDDCAPYLWVRTAF